MDTKKTVLLLGVTVFLLLRGPYLAAQNETPENAQETVPISETGEIAGAEFLIEIPENWNGGLLMYAHGYLMVTQPAKFVPGITRVGHRLGYAVAQSKYSRQGWAAREGILDTEALRRYFVAKYGETYPTIISGHSQGGCIAFATVERYPEVYDGALPMCGVPVPALDFFKRQVFDVRLLFDYYLPGLPGSVTEFPEGTDTFVAVMKKTQELIQANPDRAERFVRLVNLPGVKKVPLVIALWSEMLRELHERTGGNAFDNRDTIYTGSDDDVKLNHEIPRYESDAASVEYLRQWATLTGRISDPVVSLHTLVDELVPTEITESYNQLTKNAGTSDLFVQLYVDRDNHCQFTEDEMVEALARLTKWIKEGKRPGAGDITKQKGS